ncbi:MAG TPA: hypothetical protein P5081_02970 [Phycisphaerae bacterium]|nr:hypothetical protein [Phycisphaerae bacterium]HRW51820.1 hypothetical protein [Phycisphaerae bacterium]
MSGWSGPAKWRRRADGLRGLCVVALLFGVAPMASAQTRGLCDAMDVNCDASVDPLDIGAMSDLLLGGEACSLCAGDVNEDGFTDGADIQPFIDNLLSPAPMLGACCDGLGVCVETAEQDCAGDWRGAGSGCAATMCVTGSLTAYRPRHGAAYFPFPKTAVSANDKTHPQRGPGIRLNAPGNVDPAGEDDLIEVRVDISSPGGGVALRRTDAAMRVWLTPDKQIDSEIAFANDVTDALPMNGGASLTIYVEWDSAAHGVADLELETVGGATLDAVTFHTFRAIVMALGGEGQETSVPIDTNNGTFVVGFALYAQGYDAFLYDEDNVTADGSGSVFNEVVDAISHRGVDRVAIFGYSHGGGSTYDLADRLDAQRAGIGNFEIEFTSYVDAVGNNSDIDTSQETRRPPSTGLHANHYQHGTLFEDFFLDGGPVTNSIPAPTGLDVETTAWGAGCTHFEIDDFVQVRSFIETNLVGAMAP